MKRAATRTRVSAHIVSVALFLAASACSGPVETEESSSVSPGGKADSIHGIEEGTPEARAIVRLANTASFEVLDQDVRLDRRAAQNIVDGRSQGGYETLAELDAISFVGPSAFGKMLTYVIDHGLIGRPLSIGSFNIRWYGLDGSLHGAFGSETRNETIRTFIDEHLAGSDVLAFQEIVDVDLFVDEIMFDWSCVSYDGFSGKHQHVVLCHRPELELWPVGDDDGFALPELRMQTLRPGVQGRLVDARGEDLAYVITLHLKAGSNPEDTDVRLEQAEILAEQQRRLAGARALPFIIIGDFNTHLAERTGLPEDDEVLLGEVLESDGDMFRAPLPVAHTFVNKSGQRFRLDHAWLSTSITVLDVDVPGPCNLDFDTNLTAIVEYYDSVSDHCPVSLQLELP
jgi:endonuclease/exonuclease/phosphatase family metal-dependent hydrolase